MPKIAIIGKGGAGKTMVTSTLAYLFAELGASVIAIDADPTPTLGMALGIPEPQLAEITPIRSLSELIRERTGHRSGAAGSYFTLNPRVDDIPERFSVIHRNIRCMVMGQTLAANAGCACAENALVKALVNHLVVRSNETVLIDMVAGSEHLGRGTIHGVDLMLLVVEPSARSIAAGKAIAKLIQQMKATCSIIGNKVRTVEDQLLISRSFETLDSACFLPWNEAVLAAERENKPVYDGVPDIVQLLRPVVERHMAATPLFPAG